jgi:ubiquinone/menaquinone biosynthesis C-methylase UbiE
MLNRIKDNVRYKVAKKFGPFLPSPLRNLLRLSTKNPIGDRYYGARARNYDRDRKNQQQWEIEFAAVESVASLLPQGSRVLDLPVGSGRFIPIFERRRFKVTGMDISVDMLSEAKKKVRSSDVNLVRGDSTRIDFPANTFDLVVCFRFLQSILPFDEAKKSILEFARVTRKLVLLHLEIALRSDTSSTEFPDDQVTMGARFSEEELRNFLSDCGLQMEEVYELNLQDSSMSAAVLCSKSVERDNKSRA